MTPAIRLAAGSGPTFGVDDLACAAATHLGCWSDQGLDVTWTPVRGGVAAIQAVLDGSVDVSYGGLGPVLKARAEGKPVRVLVSMARALAQNLVAQKHIIEPAQIAGASWAIDGVGALSHHMARLIVRALGIPDAAVDWQVAGPPPERIARLLAGTIDVSLLRVEEALALSLDPGNGLHTLLGFSELQTLVPLQPHGVLAARQDYIDAHPDTMRRLAHGMIVASRRLHDDFASFRKVYDHYVTVSVSPDDVQRIWQQERASGGFARDGEVTRAHWDGQIRSYAELNPELAAITYDDVVDPRFVAQALEEVGRRGERS